jgi:hypothetical protein
MLARPEQKCLVAGPCTSEAAIIGAMVNRTHAI